MVHMKVLIVCQYFYPENFSVNDVAFSLAAMGHDVLVVTGRPNYGYHRILEGYEKVTDEVINGVRVHRCPLKPRKKGRLSIIQNYLSFWWSSRRYLSRLKEEFDVVYSQSLSPLISVVGGTIYARKHHVRHVLHCLDLWPESAAITGGVKKHSPLFGILFRWSKKIYANIDEILVSSPSFEDYFRETLGLKDIKISYVPQPPIVADPSTEVTYEVPANFVYAGNIGTLQLVERLVLAAEIASRKVDLKLHLIGMGAREEAVKALVKEHGLEDCVTFYGIKPRDITAAYYQKATGIIVSLVRDSSVGKTIPLKLISALYYGRPILGVIEGDGREVLEKAQGSVFAKDETPEAIAEAFLRLANMSAEEQQKLGESNRKYFDENFQAQKVVEEIFKHLKN